MRVIRQLDGNTYEVLQESDGNYLITHPLDGGPMWIEARYCTVIDEKDKA